MNSPNICRIANRRLLFQSLSHPPATPLKRCQWTPSRTVSDKRITRRTRADEVQEILNEPIRNPLDEISNHRRFLAKRADHFRRMKFAAAGLAVCVLAQVVIMWQIRVRMTENAEQERAEKAANGGDALIEGQALETATEKEGDSSWFPKSRTDAPNSINQEFQGKEVILAPGGQKILAHDPKSGEDIELAPTGTSTIPHFPKTIHIPSTEGSGNADDTEYTLLGLGIRTVSFLSVQVYVVGLYIQTSSLAPLQSRIIKTINPLASSLVAGEKDDLRTLLLDGEKSYEIWDAILKDPELKVETAIRVVPTRNTDFGHLRDGWVRGITARTQLAQSKGDSQFQDESFGQSMKDFKAMMQGKGSAPTGSVILLTRDGDGTLGILYEDKTGKIEDFGRLRDERIARLVWLGYLGGKTVSSEPARRGVVDGILEAVSRPIGSVESKVS